MALVALHDTGALARRTVFTLACPPPLRAQLLSSPQTRSAVASLHNAASLLAGMLVPSAVLRPPDGEPCAGAAPP